MKLIPAFLRLIRWPNLVFISLTQLLFYFCVVRGLSETSSFRFNWLIESPDIYWLILASVFIAAAGYIINDYFDLQIDAINKPGRVVVGKKIKRRWAIMWHLLLSVAGVAISLYVSYKTGRWIVVLGNILCVVLLLFYSITFKRKLLLGNVVIALLTAWVIVSVYFFAGASLINYEGWVPGNYPFDIRKLFKFTILYAGFAFIISLIREVIKDIEDIFGDAQFHCQTMPIKWGVPAAKVFAGVWTLVAIGLLSVLQVYAWQSGWYPAAVYAFFTVILPLIFVLRRLYQANSPRDYHRVSSLVKLIMLAGILSMTFFIFYT